MPTIPALIDACSSITVGKSVGVIATEHDADERSESQDEIGE
jgi:hypothetical protein